MKLFISIFWGNKLKILCLFTYKNKVQVFVTDLDQIKEISRKAWFTLKNKRPFTYAFTCVKVVSEFSKFHSTEIRWSLGIAAMSERIKEKTCPNYSTHSRLIGTSDDYQTLDKNWYVLPTIFRVLVYENVNVFNSGPS